MGNSKISDECIWDVINSDGEYILIDDHGRYIRELTDDEKRRIKYWHWVAKNNKYNPYDYLSGELHSVANGLYPYYAQRWNCLQYL